MPLPEHAEAVVFDLDGTLVDSRATFARSINHALTALGREALPPEALYPYLGPPIHDTMVELIPDSPALAAEAVGVYREHYQSLGVEGTEVFPGIRELLQSLYARVPMAIATSKVITAAQTQLDELGLRQFFEAVEGPAPAAIRESKATTLGRALAALGGPAGAVMIGDRVHDVEGAAEHGLPAIGVLWGFGSEQELHGAGAAALVRSPSEIPALLGF